MMTACFNPATAEEWGLMKTHCGKCHLTEDPEGDFSLRSLGLMPSEDSSDLWIASVDYLKSEEMPPAESNKMTAVERDRLIEFLESKLRSFDAQASESERVAPRRLNNREIAKSIADVLMIEDVGTHQPMASLLGDTLHDGFDTHGESLGISEFHLDQYIDAIRKVIDGAILSDDRPETKHYLVESTDLKRTSISQRPRPEGPGRNPDSLDFHDIRSQMYFTNFDTVPATGRYRIKIRATGVDRGVYDSEETGVYAGDPIRLSVHMGDRVRTFDLPDNKVKVIELDEWIVKGTKVQMSYPTDGLRMRGNGNFKFQYGIAAEYIKENNPETYAKVLAEVVPKSKGRSKSPGHWSHWTGEWQGPRPRVFGAEVEGPIYESWPPKRQVALLGDQPNTGNAEAILRPIAARAWRRDVVDGELDTIVQLVQSRTKALGHVEALKEGIVAILVTPSFLMINPEPGEGHDRFATKLSYLLKSTTPDQRIRRIASEGKLDSFEGVRKEVAYQLGQPPAEEFLKEFPQAWLQLDRITFMEPDPVLYKLFEKKRISEDMTNEALAMFRYAIANNIPVPELLTANYSFVNADLAKVYNIDDVPEDSVLRKYEFKDGRRGGLLGMGAFLTLTADSLGTSPIHRAVYVMENFMGIEPTPPPADVKISEPDVRSATTIREVLALHASDESCASCHRAIDPYGYAFENFGPMGEWRDFYASRDIDLTANDKVSGQQNAKPKPEDADEDAAGKKNRKARDKSGKAKAGNEKVRSGKNNKRGAATVASGIPIDASAKFRSGAEYRDIIEFRELMKADASRDRFVRCFITKLLTYANGTEPEDYTEVERILAKSAENDYRIVDTIAAVVDSPLFRE
ncbi:DUF1588 domain-containing protein [Neorhodopirellula lusitana]|nr:DUF1588 domain-containing protein [Neorhodopirellula lusitana]